MKKCDKIRCFPNYILVTDYLNENGIDYRECSYGGSPYIVIDSKKVIIVLRMNGKNNRKYPSEIYERYAENGYKGKILTKKMLTIQNVSSLLSIQNKVKVVEKKEKTKTNKKQETTYDYAEKMLNNPTKAEKRLSEILKEHNIDYVQQEVIKCAGKKYIADFVIYDKLIIEVDGGYHYTKEQIELDKERTKKLNKEGYDVVRIDNEDVLKETKKLKGLIVFSKNFINMKEYSNDFKTVLINALEKYDLHILKGCYDDGYVLAEMMCKLSDNKYPANVVVDVLDWIQFKLHYPGEKEKFTLVNENK